MKSYVSLLIGFLLLSSTSFAQFTGPSATGRISTVTEARNAPVDTYVTVTGNIVAERVNLFWTLSPKIMYFSWPPRRAGLES